MNGAMAVQKAETFDDMLQLADIAGPVVLQKQA